MRPAIVLTIILATLLTGVHLALADSPTAATINSHSLNAASRNSGAAESSTPAAVAQGKTPDCEGTLPPNGVVTALLSRIIRSPGHTQGKQCPIPPVPDHRVSQEPHE
ncbi:MAG: hypothetical protein HOP35_12285 [Nitrospira sp.]|nr:hypothetical protein [Nitrospira sp.]